MAWVNISEQTAITATLESASSDIQFYQGAVYPDGLAAQTYSWALTFSPPSRIGVQILSDAYSVEGGGTLTGGLSTDADAPNVPYEWVGSTVIMPHGSDDEPIIGGTTAATYLSYEPAAIDGDVLSIVYNIVVYVWQEPAPEPTSTCEELGRTTRNYVSAYQRDRVFRGSLYAAEKRCLVTNFNGAIPKGRSIASATWQTWDTMNCYMASPAINDREVQVMVTAQYNGHCRIRVDATLDNGEVYSAWHVIRVMPAPYFNNPGWVNGPSSLMVSA